MCDNHTACGDAGHCLYKSSADQYRESIEVKTVAVEGPAPVQLDTFDATIEVSKVIPGKTTCWIKETPVVQAEDYTGKVTGTGVKGSMSDPRKIPLAFIDPTFTDGVGRVLRHGAIKYKPGNWLNGMAWSEVIAGIKRHTSAIERGEDIDPETGELHAYHLGCGVMFLSRYMSDPRYAHLDDRMFKVKP